MQGIVIWSRELLITCIDFLLGTQHEIEAKGLERGRDIALRLQLTRLEENSDQNWPPPLCQHKLEIYTCKLPHSITSITLWGRQ